MVAITVGYGRWFIFCHKYRLQWEGRCVCVDLTCCFLQVIMASL